MGAYHNLNKGPKDPTIIGSNRETDKSGTYNSGGKGKNTPLDGARSEMFLEKV
jgi:hypothetical protein